MSDHRPDLNKLASAVRSHSIFSPSGSAMWAYCAGSLIPNIQIDDTAGLEAATGTVAHGVGELWLKTGVRPDHLIGTIERVIEGRGHTQQIFEIEITEEMLDYVEMYFDWCYFLVGQHFTEVRVDFSDLTPIAKQGGTADHTVCTWQKMIITDLKYGIGIRVYAFKNTQAILYAYGFFREWDWLYDFQEITIRICQPRLDHFDEWVITREELLDWADFLKIRAHAAWKHDAPRVPSEKSCQWCKIKSDCVAFTRWVAQATEDVFENLDKPITADDMEQTLFELDAGDYFKINPQPLHTMTVEHKAAVYKYKDIIASWFESIGRDLYKSLDDGIEVPGYKIVKGKNRRSFRSRAAVVEQLDFLGLTPDDYEPRVLLSPNKIETVLVTKGFKRRQLPGILEGMIQSRAGSPTMVTDRDKRLPITHDSDDIFENLDDI